jgi:hypothetical protein
MDRLGSKLSFTSMVDMAVKEQVEYKEVALQDDDDGDDADIEDTRELVDNDDVEA